MYRHLLQSPSDGNDTDYPLENDPMFPPDLFSAEELKNGAVLLYILGMVYLALALVVVTYEFLVPSLDVIRDKLGVSPDVAGATILAVTVSLPNLVTNTIGVFVAYTMVNTGSIVGSGVFNILGLLGISALFRDCS